MANGTPAALRAIAGKGKDREAFDADKRRAARETTPVVIEGLSFTRRRKDWATSRAMRLLMREQESAIALSSRIRVRVAELETQQVEHAAKGADDEVAELEAQIGGLVQAADEATETAELVTYRLLALLLKPPAGEDGEEEVPGFGHVEEPEAATPAVEFLQPALDVEDAADLARELTGSAEPDPQMTPSSETGSS